MRASGMLAHAQKLTRTRRGVSVRMREWLARGRYAVLASGSEASQTALTRRWVKSQDVYTMSTSRSSRKHYSASIYACYKISVQFRVFNTVYIAGFFSIFVLRKKYGF